MGKIGGRLQAVGCALLLLVCIAVSRPFAEIGINDDWSYIRTAQLFAQTGHVVFNGWAAPVFGWLAWWGALFVKWFGHSFTAVRASMLPFAALATFLLHRSMVRMGCSDWNATIGTLTVMVSPLMLPLACTFHTDLPALLGILGSLYCCLRALRAEKRGRAMVWLTLACVAANLGGTTRQIAWTAAVTFVPSTAWLLRRRRGMVALAVVLCLGTVACAFVSLHWLYAHAHTVHEPLTSGAIHTHVLAYFIQQMERTVLATPFYLLPLFIAFLPAFPPRSRKAWAGTSAAFLCLSFFFTRKALKHILHGWLEPSSGTVITPYGAFASGVLGSGPVLLTRVPRMVLTAVVLVAAIAFLSFLAGKPRLAGASGLDGRLATTSAETRVLLLPFAALYTAALLPRAAFWFIQDRYLPPLFLVAAIGLIRCYERYIAPQLPLLSAGVALALSALGTVFLHDLFVVQRAKVEAANEVLRAGFQRADVAAGLEYDTWTQLLITGYVTDYRIEKRLPGALPSRVPDPTKRCQTEYVSLIPSLDPKYYLSYDPRICSGSSPFSPVVYETWLGEPGTLYVLGQGEPDPNYGGKPMKELSY